MVLSLGLWNHEYIGMKNLVEFSLRDHWLITKKKWFHLLELRITHLILGESLCFNKRASDSMCCFPWGYETIWTIDYFSWLCDLVQNFNVPRYTSSQTLDLPYRWLTTRNITVWLAYGWVESWSPSFGFKSSLNTHIRVHHSCEVSYELWRILVTYEWWNISCVMNMNECMGCEAYWCIHEYNMAWNFLGVLLVLLIVEASITLGYMWIWTFFVDKVNNMLQHKPIVNFFFFNINRK